MECCSAFKSIEIDVSFNAHVCPNSDADSKADNWKKEQDKQKKYFSISFNNSMET